MSVRLPGRACYDRHVRRWRRLDLVVCRLPLEAEIRRLFRPRCGRAGPRDLLGPDPVVHAALAPAELVDPDHPEPREVPAASPYATACSTAPATVDHDTPYIRATTSHAQQARPLGELHDEGTGQRALADRPRDRLHLRHAAPRTRHRAGRYRSSTGISHTGRCRQVRSGSRPLTGSNVPHEEHGSHRRPITSRRTTIRPFSRVTCSTRWFLSPSVLRTRLRSCTCPCRSLRPPPGRRRTEGAGHFKDPGSRAVQILERSPNLVTPPGREPPKRNGPGAHGQS